MRKRVFSFWSLLAFCLAIVFGGIGAYVQFAPVPADAFAGAEVVGNPHGASLRALIAPAGNTRVKRVVYFDAGMQTPAVTSTPVTTDKSCGWGDFTLYRLDAYLTGTMTGTAPTLAIKWQNSIDNGTTWIDVGTWTTINATVTPASQSQVVSDIVSTTAVAYGDCWRVIKQYGGTGSVGANVKIVGYAK